MEYNEMHRNTADLHYEGKTVSGSNIIIDACELRPGRFEIAAIHPSGRMIQCREAESLKDAKKAYEAMLQQYTRRGEA